MKKLLALLMALMLVFSMVACDDNDSDRKRSKHSTKTSAVDKEKDTSDDLEIEEETPKLKLNDDFDFEGAAVEADGEFKIEITDIETVEYSSDYFVLKARMENMSEDVTYTCTLDGAAINGTMVEASLYAEVGAGKKSNEEITVYVTNLAESGITDYTDIYLHIDVSDSEDYSAEPAINEVVHVYPYGKDKAKEYKRKSKSSDEVLVDNEDVKVTLVSVTSDDYSDCILNVYIENNTDDYITVTQDDSSVNGYMIDPSFYADVAPGLTCYDAIRWSKDDFEENEITEVEEIEMTLRAYDTSYSDVFEETITLTPKMK